MKRTLGVLSLASLVALAFVSVRAQSPDGASAAAEVAAGIDSGVVGQQSTEAVSRVYMVRVKPGMDAQWLEGAKKHIAWHRQQKDPWTWTGFYVETGPDTGMYGWITSGHTWAEYDAYEKQFAKGDGENAATTMGAYEESYRSSFSVALPDISHPPAAGTTFPLYSVEHFTVHPSKRMQFTNAVMKVHGALQKGGFKGNYMWSRGATGMEGLVFTLAFPMNGWADMAENPEFERIMTAQLGEQGAAGAMRDFDDAVVGSVSWTARIQPDLTYTPGS